MLMNEQEYILQYNLFAYCGNNCVAYRDKSGAKRVKSRRKYDRAAVKKYVKKWCKSHNPSFNNLGNVDCTNFVSQCLYAGGFPMNFDWKSAENNKYMKKLKSNKYYTTSEWSNANSLCDYIFTNMPRCKAFTIKKGKDLDDVYKYLQAGDLIFFSTDRGKPKVPFNHAAIIYSVHKGKIKYAQHSPDVYRELYSRINNPPKEWKKSWYIRIYHVGSYAEWR